MQTAVIYARYSCDKQTEQSIEGQLRVCRDFAERNGYKVSKIYADRAISGRSDERPQFLKMIDDSAHKSFDYVIVYKLDRFSRSMYDTAVYKHILQKNNVRVLSATEGLTDDPSSIMLEAILVANAEYYSRELSQKVKRGMNESALKGHSCGGTTPLGYVVGTDKKLHIDNKTAPGVKKAFEMYAEGKGKSEILSWLKENGYRRSDGREITYNSLDTIFRNKKYTGTFVYNGVEVEGGCPAIIDKETFEKCQKQIQKNRRSGGKFTAKTEYYLTGKLFCGYCGEPMIGVSGTSKQGTVHNYYACRKARKSRACKKKAERKDYIEWYVCQSALDYIKEPKRKKIIAEALIAAYKRELCCCENTTQIKNEIRDLKQKIEKTVDLMIDTGNKHLSKRIDDMDEQVAQLELRLEREKINAAHIPTEQDIYDWLSKFDKLCAADPEHRRIIIDTFVNKVYLFDDKVVILFNLKDGKQVSLIDVIEELDQLESELKCSSADGSGSPKLKPHKRLYKAVCEVFYLSRSK